MIGGRGQRALGPPCVSRARPCALQSARAAHPLPAPRGPPLLSRARERAAHDARRDDLVSPSANR